MKLWETISSAPEQTRSLGKVFGQFASPGQVVLLNGDLGAGKTCFAQGVAVGMDVPSSSPVTSPSYTLLNVHQGRLPLYHFDLYRLSRVDDLADLGYDEFAEGEGITLVEWADRMSGVLPASVIIVITHGEAQQRKILFEAMDPCGETLLGHLADNCPEGTCPNDSLENL